MRESDAIEHCAWQTTRIRELEQQLAGANARIAEDNRTIRLQAIELERLRKLEDAAIEWVRAEDSHSLACELLHNRNSLICHRLKHELALRKSVKSSKLRGKVKHLSRQAAERRKADSEMLEKKGSPE
jgi:hypothetical protein